MSSVLCLMWLCLVCCVVSKSTQAWILPSPWHVHWLVMIISPARLPLVLSNWGTYSITSKSFPYLNLIVFFILTCMYMRKNNDYAEISSFWKNRKIYYIFTFFFFIIISFSFHQTLTHKYTQVYVCAY